MSAIIESRELHFSHGTRAIFEGLSFAINSGEMIALLGANGVGKTTLLNLIAGLLQPAEGRINVQGREVSSWNRRELSRFVALVPQSLEIPFSFRVDEVIAQGRVPYVGRFGSLSNHDYEVVEEAMKQVDVLGLRDRVYSELSGGEKQRVKIAIGLAQQAKVMLLDEPTQHLDIGRQIEVLQLMRRLNQSGITMVAAIHDLSIVREHFERSILLMEEKATVGTSQEILRPELLQRAFSIDASAVGTLFECEPACPGFITEERECRNTRLGQRSKPRRRILPRF